MISTLGRRPLDRADTIVDMGETEAIDICRKRRRAIIAWLHIQVTWLAFEGPLDDSPQ